MSQKRDPSLHVQLLEYDMRFERYGSEFTFYDYNEPEDLPLQLKHCFHIIVADPPYLVNFVKSCLLSLFMHSCNGNVGVFLACHLIR